MCLLSHRKSVYGTRDAMPRKTCRFRLSQKIMKFYVLTRFRETIPTVQSVLSSEIERINYGFFFNRNYNFVMEITILPLFQKLKFLGSYNRTQVLFMKIQHNLFFIIEKAILVFQNLHIVIGDHYLHNEGHKVKMDLLRNLQNFIAWLRNGFVGSLLLMEYSN